MKRFLIVVTLMLVSVPGLGKTILVLGDSISAAYGMSVESGWVSLLQDKLKNSKDHSGYEMANASISGDTTAGGLARLDQALATHKPAWVLLELGANDGLRGLSPVAMKANLAEIILRSQQAGAKVLLLAMKIPPSYGSRYVDLFYRVYPQLAQELNIPWVPFILEDVALNPGLMQADGLHPNAQAQPFIADKIAASLLPLL